MNNATTTAPENLAEIMAKFSPDEIAAFVLEYNRAHECVAEANVVLENKMFPEDSRGFQGDSEDVHTVDSIRETLFSLASTFAENIIVTDPGKPDGGNKWTKADRRQIEIPTPSGVLNVRLTHI